MTFWVLAAPAAATVLARVNDVIRLSDFVAFLVSNWQRLTHDFWNWSLGPLLGWIEWPPLTGGHKDLLTLSCLMLFSSASSYVWTRVVRLEGTSQELQDTSIRAEEIRFSVSYTFLLLAFCITPLVVSWQSLPSTGIGRAPFLGLVIGLVLSLPWLARLFLRRLSAPDDDPRRAVRLVRRFLHLIYVFTFAVFLAVFLGVGSGRPDLRLAAVVAAPFAVALVAVAATNPRNLTRIVVFAVAVFVVDRFVWLLGPLGDWLENVQRSLTE